VQQRRARDCSCDQRRSAKLIRETTHAPSAAVSHFALRRCPQVRVLLALFMDGVLFGSVTLFSSRHAGKWCIYLTHWTLVAVCAHLTLSVAGALAARRSLARGEPPPPRPAWLPVLWSAQAIALPGSLLVFVLFWCAAPRATRVPNRVLTRARAPAVPPTVAHKGAGVPWLP
jgi:hypothetical protein